MNKLYLLINPNYTVHDFNEYESAVVCSDSTENAIRIHPVDWCQFDGDGYTITNFIIEGKPFSEKLICAGGWCAMKDVKVTCIGIADESVKPGLIIASFHAG